MAAIKTSFGSGGRGLTPKGGSGSPSLATVLRGIATDLATVKIPTVTSPDATDLATAITLVNEIKTKLNVIAAATLGTTAP
jgi:hypothetical protein